MDVREGIEAGAEAPFVSTGHLPATASVQELVAEAHERYRTNTDGATSDVYPALGSVRKDLFVFASHRSAATSTPRATPRWSSRS